MLGRTRSAATGALLALAVMAPAAQAAVPDTWTRWANVPRDTTIRSLDWAGALYAASPTLPSMSPTANQVPTPIFGELYTLSDGAWQSSDFPVPVTITPAFSYKWLRCSATGADCKEIPGETGKSYKTTAADIGAKVAGYVRATHGGFSSDWYLGGMSNTVINMYPKSVVAPKVLGVPQAGQTLSSSPADGTATT